MKKEYILKEVISLCCKAYYSGCMSDGYLCEDGVPVDLVKWLENHGLKDPEIPYSEWKKL